MDDDLPFKVEQWDPGGNRIERVIARATNLIVGRSAYEAARRQYPKARLTGLSMRPKAKRRPPARGERLTNRLLPLCYPTWWNGAVQTGTGEGPQDQFGLKFRDMLCQNGTRRNGSNRITKPLLYR
jgi:hypothetical protein